MTHQQMRQQLLRRQLHLTILDGAHGRNAIEEIAASEGILQGKGLVEVEGEISGLTIIYFYRFENIVSLGNILQF